METPSEQKRLGGGTAHWRTLKFGTEDYAPGQGRAKVSCGKKKGREIQLGAPPRVEKKSGKERTHFPKPLPGGGMDRKGITC